MHKNSLAFLVSAALTAVSTGAGAVYSPPPSTKVEIGQAEPFCNSGVPPEWRDAQSLEGVEIQESRICNPDNPADIAVFVKGTNNVSMQTLMDTNLAADAITMSNDIDGDGDPDHYIIKLEVMELNGHSPDFAGVVPTFDIAPGIQPGFWVFTPKTRDMSTRSFASAEANPLLRLPAPVIRVEQGDIVWIVLENTHYFPHSIHLHGVDHPYMDHSGEGNDGVGQTGQMDVMPGQSKTYVIKPRQPGTMYYHCHVQPHTHIPMGLAGLFVVEENRPNNWVQVFNVGAGQVRHPSVAVKEKYSQEYDIHYQSVDKELHQLVQSANDPRLIAKAMNNEYDITDATDDYYLLNGRAFPYTLRESLVVVQPNEKIKLRILNGHTEPLALHTHGHKATETHYDGVLQNPSAQITRDVYSIAPAQRLDLELNTTDDGLHSYGSGLWMFHDHTEKAFTTDGQGEGGSISLIAYKQYLDERGTPKTHGMDLSPYFTKEYWQRKLPAWQNWADDWGSLGEPSSGAKPAKSAATTGKTTPPPVAPTEGTPGFWGPLFKGLLLGVLAYFGYQHREKIIATVKALISRFKGDK
ncbi:multicopper oxidase domain-containing protein [Methylococcus sp. EFPC2]|uniref:multicopper oxidase domain-containing protein n=1 Tax=Methylococcus sp. EFPC2 TaxID=2812648 RepID=UPI001967C30E|nr:multicopper oxidase domain-containing protein [Methylococcus sp. EFPC2]QSA98244.1 multicopper oxidase domain-containing protein [Methylococcus sp. EFPC2]